MMDQDTHLDITATASRTGPEPSPKQTRTKKGCLTCRVRKKRCDEARPVCATCTRLGIDCLGYEGTSKPAWMRQREVVTDMSRRIKKAVSDTRTAKMNLHWSAKAEERARQMEHRVRGSKDRLARVDVDAPVVQLDTPGPSRSDGGEIDCPLPSGSEDATIIQDLDSLLPPAIDMSSNGATSDAASFATHLVPGNSSPSAESDLDHDLISLLGIDPSSLILTLNPTSNYYPLLTQPSTTYCTPSPTHSPDMRYFDHYLKVILPYQYPFDRKTMVDLIAPLAFTNSVVFGSVTSMAALHMGSKRRRRRPGADSHLLMPDADVDFAETSLRHNLTQIKAMPLARFDTHEMIVSTMAVASFHLFDGGNRKGWRESVDLCRRCLASSMRGQELFSPPDTAGLISRLGHLLNPLIWTDILTSVTEGVASKFLPLYRTLLLDGHTGLDKARLLKETVMGCDSTTRLAIAEAIALSEWKQEAQRIGQLSLRSLLAHASAIERLLDERCWRENHLFEATDLGGVQRKAMSDVFYNATRVLLATVVNGCFPDVLEVATAVRDTVSALTAMDSTGVEGADRALVFPIVIASAHASTSQQRRFFQDRFSQLGEEAQFGNTQSALRLINEVWRQRDQGPPGVEVCWRRVMFELDDEGLLLI